MFTYALNEIATRTEHLQLLRPEIEIIINQEGWNKGSISKMYKLDSFLREVHRCYDLQLRKASHSVLHFSQSHWGFPFSFPSTRSHGENRAPRLHFLRWYHDTDRIYPIRQLVGYTP